MFQNEMMTGTYTQNPVMSRITLALMEDTGFVLLCSLFIILAVLFLILVNRSVFPELLQKSLRLF